MGAAEFEVDGTRFVVERLKYADAARGIPLVTNAIGNASGGDIQMIGAAVGLLPDLIKLFTPVTKFDHVSGRTLALTPAFAEDLFGDGRLANGMLYVMNCIAAEYGGFFADGLPSLERELERLFPVLTAPTADSGESSSPSDSPSP